MTDKINLGLFCSCKRVLRSTQCAGLFSEVTVMCHAEKTGDELHKVLREAAMWRVIYKVFRSLSQVSWVGTATPFCNESLRLWRSTFKYTKVVHWVIQWISVHFYCPHSLWPVHIARPRPSRHGPTKITLPISAGSSPAVCQDPAATLAATHRKISSYIPADPRLASMCHVELVWVRKNRTTNFQFWKYRKSVAPYRCWLVEIVTWDVLVTFQASRSPRLAHGARQNSNMLEFSRPLHGESAASSRPSRSTWPGREK